MKKFIVLLVFIEFLAVIVGLIVWAVFEVSGNEFDPITILLLMLIMVGVTLLGTLVVWVLEKFGDKYGL